MATKTPVSIHDALFCKEKDDGTFRCSQKTDQGLKVESNSIGIIDVYPSAGLRVWSAENEMHLGVTSHVVVCDLNDAVKKPYKHELVCGKK